LDEAKKKVLSYKSLDEAKKKVLSYKKKGLSPYWTEVHLGEAGIWFRVFAGCFKGPEQAKRFREEHQLEKATVRKTRYANFIGAYSHATNLENHIQSLRLFGYSPYVIKDPEGKSRLFVGAFLTKAGAERQYRDLKSIGIQGDVVLR
jgi:cell division protein FtsN